MVKDSKKDDFLSLILENRKLIYKVSHLYCRNPEDRKDLIQEIIIQLWKSADRYDDKYRLSTWMYRVALNTAISFYRNESRRKKRLDPFDENIMELAGDDSSSYMLNADLKLLYEFIGKMDELNKGLMLLYLDGYSYNEISGILGITVTNAATKLSRIKQNLKNEFLKSDN